jgi:hypothetical protein
MTPIDPHNDFNNYKRSLHMLVLRQKMRNALPLPFLLLVASAQTIVIVLSISDRYPETLLLLPTFCLYIAGLLAYRLNLMERRLIKNKKHSF